MLIDSSTSSAQDIPVLILACSDANGLVHSRKIVARPPHYHDLVVTARKLFHLEDDAVLAFGTSTLDVCRGAWIEIDESAYEPLLKYLDEVIFRPSAPHHDVDGDDIDKGSTRESNPIVDAYPIFEKAFGPPMPARRRPDTSISIVSGSNSFAPEATMRVESTMTTQPSSSSSHPKSQITPNPEPAAPKSTGSRLLIQLDAMSKQRSNPSSNSRQRKPEPQSESGRELRAAELEVEEKQKPKFRPASALRHFKEEPEPEPLRAPQRKLHPKPEPPRKDTITGEVLDTGRQDGVEDEDEDFWRFGTKSVSPSSLQQESVPQPITSSTSNPKMGTTICVEVKNESEKKKIRNARARLSTVNATQLPRASERPLAHFVQDPDQRFMVTVHGPRAGQGADFRTRGGHKIKKVLESVCKTFQLPFERSQLVLEDDSKDVTLYYCDPEETVGMCGIDTDARLLVQVGGMTDEELNQFGEEEEEED